jgi:hypothetical protein
LQLPQLIVVDGWLACVRCYYWGVSASSMAILGNVAMQGLTVVFDREVDQIGFATVSPRTLDPCHSYRRKAIITYRGPRRRL